MVISWKELSSSTAISSGAISGVSHSSGWPILPPTWTIFPSAASSLEIMVVVVVLPSEPVTARMGQGQTAKNASISEVMTLPPATAAASSGTSGRRPGVRKITFSWRSARYPLPSRSLQP